ncbi:TolC family protein, partial [Massilia glaciei]
ALARASAAEGSGRVAGQRALCELDIKALAALTGEGEPALRARLAGAAAVPAPPLTIAYLPAQVLAQRPDVFNAEREVAAASADVGAARAQRYPRLALQGSVGLANFRSGGESVALDTWSIGPLALTVPIFNAGRLAANVDAAGARYDAAVVNYRASARRAVSEVEQALVNLDSSTARIADARVALEGYQRAFKAAEDRYKNGMAGLIELEETRRLRLAADNAAVTLQRERNQAWVALYRAAGGGWTRGANQANF